MQRFGGLPLGDTFSLQDAILVEQSGASSALPPRLAIRIATLHGMHYSAHSSILLPKLIPYEKGMAKDGEVATSFQVLSGLRLAFARSLSCRDGPKPLTGLTLAAPQFEEHHGQQSIRPMSRLVPASIGSV